MKLTDRTLAILKNFANINPSILVHPGKVLKTISPSKTILAAASIDNEFENKFAIYSLSKFLGAVSMLESPELQFHDSYVVIGGSGSGGTKSVKYVYADETVIMTPPPKDIKLPSIDASFVMTEASLKDVIKATGVLGLSDVAVVGNADRVTLQALDSKNPTGDVYSVDVGETDKVFKAIFKAENLVRLLPTAYDVNLCSKGISQFLAQGSHETLSYFVAVESNSVFE